MTINSIQPNFTGRKLSSSEATKLIKNNWTIPMGVNNIKLKKNHVEFKTSNFGHKIKDFFKNLFGRLG